MHLNYLLSELVVLAGLATYASAQNCADEQRFGDFKIAPADSGDLSANLYCSQRVIVTADFACAVQNGNTPTSVDFYIDAHTESSSEEPLLFASRTYQGSTSSSTDTFTTTVCVNV
jgi:hypothetical protein